VQIYDCNVQSGVSARWAAAAFTALWWWSRGAVSDQPEPVRGGLPRIVFKRTSLTAINRRAILRRSAAID